MASDIQEGTVIHGTHRPEDLIPALMEELERVAPITAKLTREGTYAEEIAECLTLQERGEDLPWEAKRGEHGEWFSECIDTLIDRLDYNAPQGMYFGTHPGDGSDFGWWRQVNGG